MIWPRLGRCPRCDCLVLVARGRRQGHPFRLEPVEVFPVGTCGPCRGTGRVRVRLNRTDPQGASSPSDELGAMAHQTRLNPTSVACHACQGTGRRGEPIPARVVALNPIGVARRLLPGQDRRTDEALHRPHICIA